MALIDPGGGGDGGGGIGITGEEADATLLGGEATLHAFSPEHVENAQRNIYRADASGVTYALTLSMEALKPDNAALVNTVAREYAAMWNKNAAVTGVLEIAEVQDTTPLGQLVDIAQVAIESTSGRSQTVLELPESKFPPDLFAAAVGAAVAGLDALENV